MAESKKFLCDECDTAAFNVRLSGDKLRSYEEDVEQVYDESEMEWVPETKSFREWAYNNDIELRVCAQCGSDGSITGNYD